MALPCVTVTNLSLPFPQVPSSTRTVEPFLISSGSCLTTTWALQMPLTATNEKNTAAVLRSACPSLTKIGPARHAGSGARRKALFLISIASGRADQLDLPLPACPVIHQHRGAGSELAFHRLLSDDNLSRANSVRAKHSGERNRAYNWHSHGWSSPVKLPGLDAKMLLLFTLTGNSRCIL
jgi:hypothetical protein